MFLICTLVLLFILYFLFPAEIFCSKLLKPINGNVRPTPCLSRGQFGDMCTFSCDGGYEGTVGKERTQCNRHGQWTVKFNDFLCKGINSSFVTFYCNLETFLETLSLCYLFPLYK